MKVSLADYPELAEVVEIQLEFTVTITSACFDAEIYFTDDIPILFYEADTEAV